MDAQKVDMFIMTNGRFFEPSDIFQIRESLLAADEARWAVIQSIQFTDPTTSLIVSLLAGSLGVDRFMIGDTGIGVAKLLTCGGLGIWAIVDLFMIQTATKKKNTEKIQQLLLM